MAGFYDMKFHVPLVHVDPEEEEEEDLVTIVEKEKFDIQKKTVIVTDKFRTVEKILACENLKDFLAQGRESLGYSEDEEVYAVLEEDGTEVDEEEYWQYIPQRTCMIVMSRKETWTPVDTWQSGAAMESTASLCNESLADALMEHLCKLKTEEEILNCSRKYEKDHILPAGITAGPPLNSG